MRKNSRVVASKLMERLKEKRFCLGFHGAIQNARFIFNCPGNIRTKLRNSFRDLIDDC